MNATKWISVVLVAASGLMLSGCADLTVSSLTLSPENPTTESKIVFTAVIENIGKKQAGPSTMAFQVGGETVPAQYEVPALDPGQTYTATREETLSRPGHYLVTVTANCKDEVREPKGNNVRRLPFAVRAP